MTDGRRNMNPTFFATPARFYQWLLKHHVTRKELLVGFYKSGSGRPSVTWPQAVDQALCFGWIDGVRQRIDDERYTVRFTPRRPRSRWSAVNLRRLPELERLGLMQPAGRAAYADRNQKESGYSHEQRIDHTLPAAYEKQLRANQQAWDYFRARPPWYRRTAAFWVTSAKKEETRLRRLRALIEDSSQGRHVAPLRPRTGT